MRIAPLALAVTLIAASCGGVAGSQTPAEPRIAASGDFTCVVVDDGGVACWGDRRFMGAGFVQGDAALGISPPVAVALPSGKAYSQVTATRSRFGYRHACALANDGTAWCWGDNQVGELGSGTDCCGETPAAVDMPNGVSFTQISAGDEHTCALAEDGGIWCWGSGDHGQLGDGSPTAEEWNSGTSWHVVREPAPVLLPDGVAFTQVDSGSYHTCALTDDGEAWCWGDDMSVLPKALPVAMVMPEGVSFEHLEAGEGETCGLTAGGAVWCWANPAGRYEVAQFGVTAPEQLALPTGVTFTRISLGRAHACGVATDGGVWCWGAWGGYGTPGSFYGGVAFPEDAATVPVELSGPSGRRFTDVATGDGHTCAIATDATVWCWGYNDFGQLGDGTTVASLTPVQVPIDLAAPAPAPSPSEPLTLEPVELAPYSGDVFLAPPPLWTLDVERSRRIYGLFVGGGWQVPEYWGLPDACIGRGDAPEASPEECMFAYYARLGVSLEALSLLHDYGVTVSRFVGSAPVWVAETYDWGTFETNYDGATPNLIFTPEGIIDLSAMVNGALPVDLTSAYAAAFSSNVDEEIRAAAAAAWNPDELYLGVYAENFDVPLASPERTAAGWSIPFSVQSGAGVHCCSYPFWARFELDLNARGDVSGVRFRDWCYVERVTFGSGEIPEAWPDVIRDLGATMSPC